MSRFVQPVPAPDDPYTGDRLLRSWLERQLGPAGHAAAKGRLADLAADVVGPLRAAHADAEAHPPRLVRYDGWGARVDRIDTSPGWRAQRAAAARHAVVALPYLDSARGTWGAAARVVQHALLHLYGPESATFSCPVAMADGAAALLSMPEVDAAVRDAWLPRLISTDPDTAITSGQWMTEAQGGSDLGRSTTVGRPAADGSWRLSGEKWFCSAADAAMAVALARPEGAGRGSRVLAPFLVPRYAADSPLAGALAPDAPAPGVTVHRLKDKLGTRALPTAEIGLRDAYALPLGDPAVPGLVRAMTLVVVTRVHNAAAAAGGMRRGLAYARGYAEARHVAGGPLSTNPLHRATLGALAVDSAGAFVLAGHAFALLGRVEVGADPQAAAELRIVAPLAKLATGRLAVASAAEYVESFGGAGYVEDTGVPRLLRDAQVLPIWEGTTNVLAVDVLRAVSREDAAGPLLRRLDAAADLARPMSPALADTLAAVAGELREELAAVAADPGAVAVVAGARGLALRMAYALTAALLVEHAAWGDEQAELAARLWARRWLRHEDIAADAHHHLDLLG
ncbi:acyl-CoA dehydrogenase family protein [Micromonospora endolithica]|uniref:Acyl-CoA dehydrogenase n=1 Tax=Micromonospora endolithica TaxID=230091 RepID=A0A3A9Z082_9ACTN|nr:acyl-CoA dehydrogenase family protein [Micromonospora endolithica]RKN41439.1 acyl-CoA dehydrogenase [Micromonospora endolithica]TWJ21863.1 alkylation response protein AidB-like acyl-CoA dehydrogenase [Micromonospora endolithica]